MEKLGTMRELIKNPTRENLTKALHILESLEDVAAGYRGYEPVEEALFHVARLKRMAEKYGIE